MCAGTLEYKMSFDVSILYPRRLIKPTISKLGKKYEFIS